MDRDTRKKLFWSIGGILAVAFFFGIFIGGLPWYLAFDKRVAEMQARGEPICATDLAPKPVPDAKNGGPLLELIWQDLNSPGWKNAPALANALPKSELQDLIRQEQAQMQIDAAENAELAGLSKNELASRKKSDDERFAIRKKEWLKLSSAEQEKINNRQRFRRAFRDLNELLTAQPDLLERFETALARPHFHFKVTYKSPCWTILLPHLGSARQTTNLFADLSLYYDLLGESAKAQRYRLLLLRTPQTTAAGYSIIDSLVHAAQSGIVCYHLGRQLPLLSQEELSVLQATSAELQAWSTPWPQMMMNERVMALDAILLRGATINEATQAMDTQAMVFLQIYYRTGLRYYDGLRCLDEYQLVIDGRPLPPYKQLSYIGKQLLPNLDSVKAKYRLEAAKIRQLRLAIAIELIKRQSGSYPPDLRHVALPQEDAEGKPMTYEVFAAGRGACLEFYDKLSSKSIHLPLGDAPESHQK